MDNSEGSMGGSFEAPQIFVDKWRQSYPSYQSPYQSSSQLRYLNSTSSRQLQSDSNLISGAIICTMINYPVSFSISEDHFPIYVKDSLYNTNSNFDSGPFDQLELKIKSAGMFISTFMYSFSEEGVYVFGDYQNSQNSQTIIKVSEKCGSQMNLYPLTEKNLNLLGIAPQEFAMKSLPESLVYIPVVFITLTFVSTFVQYILESNIEKNEIERRMRRAGRRRNFQNIDGKLDKKQYLGDLYKLIKDNLDEVKKLIDSHDNKENLYKLLKNKTSLVNELGDNGKQMVDDLKNQLKSLLSQLRFPDGRTLNELLLERQLKQKLQGGDSGSDQNDLDDLENDSDLDRHTVSQQDDNSMEHDSMYSDDMESSDLINATRKNLQFDSDEEQDEGKEEKDEKEKNNEVERLMKMKKEQSKRKDQFKDKIFDLIDHEQDRDKLIDQFDGKMRQLGDLLKNESQSQDDILRAKLANRKQNKKNAVNQLEERTAEKNEKINQLEEEKAQLQYQIEEILDNGMKDPRLQEIANKEKEQALKKLELQKDEQIQLVRDDYLNRLKYAKDDAEKEKILEEMHRRLSKIEQELDKEKGEQEKNLDKILKQRQQRRVKKIAAEHEKQIQKKDEEIETLQKEIAKEQVKVYAEFGGDAPEVLDSRLQQKISEVLKKTNLETLQNFDLDKNDKEQLEIFKVQLNIEKDQALNAVEKELEDSSDLDRVKMEEELKNKLTKEREEYNQKIGKAKSEDERKKLIKEAKNREKKIQEMINNERLKQERLLEERKMNRQARRKIKELELEQKQMGDIVNKEVEILQKKYDQLNKEQDSNFDQGIKNAISQMVKRPDQNEQALIVLNECSNESLKNKLRLLINKQFFELEKHLGSLYTQTAMNKMIEKEKIKEKFKGLEEEAYKKYQGDELVNKLHNLKQLQEQELQSIEQLLKQQEKETECQLREKLEDKFFQEKKELIEHENQKKIDSIQEIVKDSIDPDSQAKEIATKLISQAGSSLKDDIESLSNQRDLNLERIKLQIVAENEAEVQQMQKKIEEQMRKEKEEVDERMKKKRDEVMGEKKKRVEERIQEMTGQLSDFQREQILKQYQQELDNLDRVIAQERENQLTKMRQMIVRRKIEQQRLKKEEEQAKKAQEIKDKMGLFLSQYKSEEGSQDTEKRPTSAILGSISRAANNINPQRRKSTILREKLGDQINLADKLKLMLKTWNDRVTDEKDQIDDPQAIWEKNSDALSLRSGVSRMSKQSRLTGASRFTSNLLSNHQSSTLQIPQQQNYTMEELMKRVRRIEKLTDNMSMGKFEGNQKVKQAEQQLLSALQSTRQLDSPGRKPK